MGKAMDLTGKTFGRLTVIDRVGYNKHKSVLWRCACECGKEVVVPTGSLTSGNTQSCGCLHNDLLRVRRTSHGLTKTRLYKIWTAMKARCYDINNISYKYYGALGIGVCNGWRNDFVAFYDWAMEHGYDRHLTIDRIDNTKDYAPSNCRWISLKAQQSNRKSNHIISYNGKTQTLSQWAEELGISRHVLSARICSYNWDVERAFTQEVRKSPSKKKG